MLKLSAQTRPHGVQLDPAGTHVFRISRVARHPSSGRHSAQIVERAAEQEPGFSMYLCYASDAVAQEIAEKHAPVIELPDAMRYLDDGDVISVNDDGTHVRAIYRRRSKANSFLVTERCNHYCIMCSQPPRDRDDSFLVDDILELIPLIDRSTAEIGLTGGEPTLDGEAFFRLVERAKRFLPETSLHVLTNGRRFVDFSFASRLASIRHHDLMLGIPLYSDWAPLHNFVVQSDCAFDETIRGIINLKSLGLRVEIRFVLQRHTVPRLKSFADFVARNLLFVDHVAFMGLETVGFAKSNLKDIWIDPQEYMGDLEFACLNLGRNGCHVSVYNSQLCLLPRTLLPYYRHSISDWKNEFVEECSGCYGQTHCGGFFSSNKTAHSAHLRAFGTPEDVCRFLYG